MMLAPALLALAASEPVAARARAALEQACGGCHRGGPDADEGGFDFVLDRDALIREGLIVPGRASASPLYLRVKRGEMPPADAKERRWRGAVLPALEAWIRAGAQGEGYGAGRDLEPAAVTPAELSRQMRADLLALTPEERPAARYFTGPADASLDKALSSLTWAPELVHAVALSPQLRRIDLRALGWTEADWEQVLAAYPFGVATGSFDDEAISAATQSPLAFVRAEWFVATATRPPLYHALLRLGSSESDLEAKLGVNTRSDIARRAVVRAGFNNSGVSQNNRLIERHTTRYGPYWRSYDFASNVGSKNLFERPLTFEHDGGEHIFCLPNGMLGYLLTNAKGARIDRGPTAIVRDERRPDGAVENGLSCMGCHARGFIPKADQLLEAVQASPAGFTPSQRRLVAVLHPGAETLSGIFTLDTRRFVENLGLLGVANDAQEPITAAALRYERTLDLKQSAVELGVAPHVLFRALDRGPESMAPLRVGGSVKRDAFTAAFPLLVKRVGAGRALAFKPAPAAAACDGVDACAVAFPSRATQGAFRLMTRSAAGKEVWLDTAHRLLWSAPQAAVSQSAAAEQCSREAEVDARWFLPSARQLEDALAEGLPDVGWQALWSRDADNTRKLERPLGLAVGASGRSGEAAEVALPSRCVARLPGETG